MECPGWINESLLSRVYASANPAVESTQVIKCSSVVGLGDNYLSKMYRLTVKVTTTDKATREDSLVIKSLEKTMESMKDYGIFRTEEAMYSSILPVFEGYWSENGKPVEFGPRWVCIPSQSFHNNNPITFFITDAIVSQVLIGEHGATRHAGVIRPKSRGLRNGGPIRTTKY